MRKLRHYCLFLLVGAAILAGCGKKAKTETNENEKETPSFYSPFKLF
jgi:hypothetical protein